MQRSDPFAAYQFSFAGPRSIQSVTRNRDDRVDARINAFDSLQVCFYNFDGRSGARANERDGFGCRFVC